MLCMVVHELLTNAAKYGALSCADGHVDLRWLLTDEPTAPRLCLSWRERGGPPVTAPTAAGFGTRIIEQSISRDLDDEVQADFGPAGLLWRAEFPLA